MALRQNLGAGLKNIHKMHGQEIGGLDPEYVERGRYPTGILNVDVGTGGGFPRGATTTVYGRESSGKTSLSLRTLAQYQRRWPEDAVVWVDAENTWDRAWSERHGVDCTRVHVFRPTTIEQVVDVVDQCAFSEDVGLIVIDSLAAVDTVDALEKSAEEKSFGGSSSAIARMTRKLTAAIAEHHKVGRLLSVLQINQVRVKVGFVLGNPEITPGGDAPKFHTHMRLRLNAKPVLDKKVAAVPIYAENSAKIDKNKVAVVAHNFEWNTILHPYKDFKTLDVNNARQLEKMLDGHGMLVKQDGGKSWGLWGETYATKTEAVASALADYDQTVENLVDYELRKKDA